MAQYHFDMPEGWLGVPLPPPHTGVHMRPAAPQGPLSRAVIVLLGPSQSQGTLAEDLAQMVIEGTAGVEAVRQAEALPFRSATFPGLLTAVRLRPAAGTGVGEAGAEEGRIFALLDAGEERIPVVFAGAPGALPQHQAALQTLLSSLRPHTGGADSPFAGWTG